MSTDHEPQSARQAETVADIAPPPMTDTLEPLAGEPGIPDIARRSGPTLSRKALIAGLVLIASIVSMLGMSIHRFTASAPADPASNKRPAQRPSAAATEAKRLDLSIAPPPVPAGGRIPALVPTAEERAAPIGLQGGSRDATRTSPEDAPVMLLSSKASGRDDTGHREGGTAGSRDTSRSLQDAQRQTHQLLDTLIRRSEAPNGSAGAASLSSEGQEGPAGRAGNSATQAGTGALLGGQMPKSSTPRTEATRLVPRSLVLPKGSSFTCALKTRIVSATAGLVGCQVQRNLYSEDGRVLLVERGSHLDGEYRVTSVKPGTVRIPLLWTRLRTPQGISVDLDSPGTGPLGESGVDGHVDNRWGERIGAALLLSLIDDAVRITVAHQTEQTGGVVLSSTTDTGSDLASKVLESTIGIPPVITQHQGAIVGVHVARDVDFSSVYELMPTERLQQGKAP